MNALPRTLFVSGIDTDAGKTYATAYLAKMLMAEGKSVITQKFIQTGCDGYSEDIRAHRRLTGTGELPEDREGLTAPVIFKFPSSPQLAARMEGRPIDLAAIENATHVLQQRYDHVLIEGAGGLMVPISDDYFTIDYISDHRLPLTLVTNGILGSINHTILSLEALRRRKIELACVIYNHHFDYDPQVTADTRAFIRQYLRRHNPGTPIIEMP